MPTSSLSSPTKRTYSASQFDLFEELGHGAYGNVYRGVDKLTKGEVAIKQIDLESDENILEFKREIALLSTCHNDNITRYFGCFVKGFKLWIIMEYLPGGSLSDLLIPGPLEELAIKQLTRDIVLALDYLHESGKIHRDLKPANILISREGSAKIADFGVSTQLSNKLSLRNTYIGTPYYMAPEVIMHHNYNFKADIWSLGITLLELANGKPPLYQYHPMQAVYLIEKNEPPSLVGSEFSDNFKDFVDCCLKRDPNERPTTKSLLKHKFLQSSKKNAEQLILDLVDKKNKWDENYNHGRFKMKKYYTPTVEGTMTPSVTSEDTTEFDFDVESFENHSHSTLKAEKPESLDTTELTEMKKKNESNEEAEFRKLAHDLNSILNQSFNKVSSKINLSTYQYDHLVSFKTNFINDAAMDEHKKNRDIFQIFFRNFLKRVYNSDNQYLKEKFLPKIITENQNELFELRKQNKKLEESLSKYEKKRGTSAKAASKDGAHVRKRDHVEELLLSRWAEGMIERWTR